MAVRTPGRFASAAGAKVWFDTLLMTADRLGFKSLHATLYASGDHWLLELRVWPMPKVAWDQNHAIVSIETRLTELGGGSVRVLVEPARSLGSAEPWG